MNTENTLFLLARSSSHSQDIKISFEYVDFYAKLSLILNIQVRNSTTQWTILLMVFRKRKGQLTAAIIMQLALNFTQAGGLVSLENLSPSSSPI